jgi:Flp pilus assembly protein TadG
MVERARKSVLDAIRRQLASFRGARGGNVAMIAAIAAPVLIGLAFGVIDISRASASKAALQDSLDAAALFAARSSAVTDAQLQAVGAPALAANLYNVHYGALTASSFKASSDGRAVIASAQGTVPTTILGLFGTDTLTIAARSEVMRSSNNVEVALVLDTTGSMAGQKIADLKAAAKDLVDVVVQPVQTPYYSKVALAPYSMAVNVGPTIAPLVRGTYTNGTCTTPGCQKFKFKNPSNVDKTFTISNCVSERTGADAFTDTAPSTTPLGRNYPSPNNPCLTNTIAPLSSDKVALKNQIDTLSAGGSTGGHVGVAWGWYLVSPKFAYLWPAASRPVAYGTPETLKVVVLMTDGEYNSAYCKGVISQDSIAGSGSADDHISCDAPNGGAFTQAETLCANMKRAGVIVYTVGFNVVSDPRAQDLVNHCATDASHVYLPATGAALKDAFHAIGQDINSLRLSR